MPSNRTKVELKRMLRNLAIAETKPSNRTKVELKPMMIVVNVGVAHNAF